jgi:hypothetical protein
MLGQEAPHLVMVRPWAFLKLEWRSVNIRSGLACAGSAIKITMATATRGIQFP